jgi:hypothetical protein
VFQRNCREMGALSSLLLFLPLLFSLLSHGLSQCYKNCNQHGLCNEYSRCDCFTGYEGDDCSKRSCPTGRLSADIASSAETAHEFGECSGRGTCNYQTGLCVCDFGFFGLSCQMEKCSLDCNGNGKCVSLKQAAENYDGWSLNHTTSYTLWDAVRIYGCQCDPGWVGSDCSERFCESGPDPRSSSSVHSAETITLICATGSNSFSGKFKFRFRGQIMKHALNTSSTVTDLARELMKMTSGYSNAYPSSSTPITVTSDDANGLLCAGSATVTTSIQYHKRRGDVSALSLYFKKLTGAALYFQVHLSLSLSILFFSSSGSHLLRSISLSPSVPQTTQYLQCDCLNSLCGGSFQLVYDGEVSSRINLFELGSTLYSALSDMKTLSGQTIVFQNETFLSSVGSTDSAVTICSLGVIQNHTIVLQGPIGNLPSFTLITSGVSDNTLSVYVAPENTSDTSTRILSLFTSDGRDEGVKFCNGLGKCNSQTGKCDCAFVSPPSLTSLTPLSNFSSMVGMGDGFRDRAV